MLPGRLSNKHYLFVLVLAFLLLAMTYSLITLPFESPDEVGHFYYIIHILTNHSLPLQRVGALGEAHQPPLYYVIGALVASPANLEDQTGQFRSNPEFMWGRRGGNDVNAGLHGSAETFPFRGYSLALHLVRTASVLMGAVTVAFTVLIAWKVFPNQPQIGLLAGALVAFNPQFLFISGSVNNDNLLTMLTTIGWWQILRAMSQPEQKRQWAYVGALIGAGFLAKVNGGLVLGSVAGIALLACALKRRSLKLLVNGAWMIVVTVVLLSGWWFVRNQVLYGDLMGWRVYQEVFAVNLRHSALRWWDVKDFYSVQSRSFWGIFGWMNVPSPQWLFRVYSRLCLVSLAGLVIRSLYYWLGKQKHSESKIATFGLLLIAFVMQEAYMLAVITRCDASCYQGRYAFPAIAPLMIILGSGLTGWLLLLPQRWEQVRTLMVGAVILGLLSLAVFVPFKVIAPAYRIVPISNWRLWLVPYKADFHFDGMFRLRGYEISTNEEAATVTLVLYWQALQQPDSNYSVSVHLIDASNRLVTQTDHVPGEGSGYPPIAWLPGDIIADEHRIEIPPQWPSGSYRFRIGVYNWATGEPLPVLVNGEYAGDFVILDRSVQR